MKPAQNHWRLIARLTICVTLLFWIFHVIFVQEGRSAALEQGGDWDALPSAERLRIAWTEGPPAIWATLHAVSPGAYALSLLFMGAILLVGTLRWRLALGAQGLELPLIRATEISLIAHFFNSFLLGSTGGDLLKAYYAARETHHKKTEAVTTVFVDRLIGLFAMLFFAVAMATPCRSLITGHELTGLIFLTVLAMFGASSVLVFLAFWGRSSNEGSVLQGWLRRMPRGEYLEKSLQSCRMYGRHPAFLIQSLGLSMLLNLLCVLQFATLAHGLGLDISISVLMFIVPSIICISALPITPSGLGVREHLFVGALSAGAISIDGKLGLSLSLLAFSGSLVWSVIGGVVYVNLKDSQHLDEVTHDHSKPEDGFKM